MSIKKHDHFKSIYTERMQSFLEEMGFNNMNHADPVSLGKAFLKFYLYDIFSAFYDIDEDEIASNIVDGKNDLDIDFAYIIDSQIFIVQSKYGNSYKGEEDLSRFVLLPKNLKIKEYIDKANPELKEILEEIKKIKNPSFNLFFITTQKIDDELLKHYEQTLADNHNVVIYDRSKLWIEYNRAQTLADLPPNQINLNFGDEDYLELNRLKGEYPTLFLTQKATKVKDLYLRYKETLFNYNIRLWLGSQNSVNKGMIDTLYQEPSNFFYYNNGVTAVCEEYSIDGNNFTFKNFQIINGAQTVTTIAKQDVTGLSEAKIFFKIIVGESGRKTKDPEGLNEKIVKNTNSQSVISPSDFRSNDPIQLSIEKKSDHFDFTVNSPFKTVFYKRKRRKELPKKNSKAISMQDLGKAYYAYMYNPYELNASIKNLWDVTDRGAYYKVFGNEGERENVITEEKLYSMFGIYYIYEYIKKKLKERNKEDDPAILFKYHILWGFRILLNMKYSPSEIQKILKDIVKKGFYVNDRIDASLEKKFNKYLDKLIKHTNLYIKREKKSEETFVLRNSQRSKRFADGLKMELEELISADDLESLQN